MSSLQAAQSLETPPKPRWNSDDGFSSTSWEPLRRPVERWPHQFDFLVATLSFSLTLAMWGGVETGSVAGAGALLLAFVGNFALLWRRSHPLQVHALLLVASVITQITPETKGLFALSFSLYSLGRYTADDRASLIGMLVALAYVSIDLLVLGSPEAGNVIAASLVMLLWYAGRRLRFRGEYLRILEERAMYLERERSVEAERAVAKERTRIARELHDIVAHQVSLMTVQAGAARTVATTDPEAATRAMAAVEKAGRQALTEMRHLLDVLRPGRLEKELGPQPGVEDLPRLVDEVRETGLSITLHRGGSSTELPRRVDLAVYRIVQESLTNVMKHAGSDPQVDIHIEISRESVALTVSDDGQGSSAPAGIGHGITGMRERAELLGGSLQARSGPNGGFLIRAVLPVGDSRS
ncbi:sensor histidine kinase [Congregibacter brevis]|uniref:histidine kinase n=1 Tax=Congregibacter brevis TaxID=3081201 RepID=A0ABZ0IIM1_9GAMM|nr:sensor histidine kinase [Congregibacter sp. IMCC45268]